MAIAKSLSAILALALLSAPGQMAANSNLDNPNPPINAHAALSDDYNSVTVTWGFPGEVGESGGFVDESKITYYIFDAFGSFFDPAIAVTTETSCVFDYSGLGKQDFEAYQITAGMDETWYSLPANTNIVCVGPPQELPFVESAAGGKFAYVWAIDPESSPKAEYKVAADGEGSIDSQDGDNGYLLLSSSRKGASISIISVKISLEGAENPALRFYCQGRNSQIKIWATTDGEYYESIYDVVPDEDPSGWACHNVSLANYKGASYAQLKFEATFVANNASALLDNISVYDDSYPNSLLPLAGGQPSEEARFYTLSGLPIEISAAKPGAYVKTCAGKSSKIIIR